MSFYQIRRGKSIYHIRNQNGVKKIVTFIRLEKGGNRFKNPVFDNIKHHYGVSIDESVGELNNKMQGKFDVIK